MMATSSERQRCILRQKVSLKTSARIFLAGWRRLRMDIPDGSPCGTDVDRMRQSTCLEVMGSPGRQAVIFGLHKNLSRWATVVGLLHGHPEGSQVSMETKKTSMTRVSSMLLQPRPYSLLTTIAQLTQCALRMAFLTTWRHQINTNIRDRAQVSGWYATKCSLRS